MEIVFGILVLALIVLGLRKRKKEKKVWVKEERFEESGDWIDKRSGERGTYGTLDDEMEANRRYISRQSKVSALALSVQSFCFDQIPEMQGFDAGQIKQHLALCKAEINGLFDRMDQLLKGRNIADPKPVTAENDVQQSIKKQVLDFAYAQFPALLDLEIPQIKQLDALAAQLAVKLSTEMDGKKALKN